VRLQHAASERLHQRVRCLPERAGGRQQQEGAVLPDVGPLAHQVIAGVRVRG
jgi:hypothetical protein